MAESLLADIEALGEEIPADLLEELDREIARNAEANRLAKEREREAKEARDRALQSQQRMQSMLDKYDEVQTRVERTKQTLEATAEKVEKQNRIRSCIEDLKARADRIEMTKLALERAKALGACGGPGVADLGAQGKGKRVDYAQTVQRLQEKLASKKMSKMEEEQSEGIAEVQSKLDDIAISEECLRTKEAKLLAMKKEKEAMEAEEAAKKKEQEAQEMRRKVADLQRLLSERKNKLTVTEKVIEKKANVVDKVEKILHSRERRANYVEKRKIENIMFKPKPEPKKEE